MIKNIIFDIGKVLVDFDPDLCLKQFGYDEELRRRIQKATTESPVWHEYDHGIWSREKVLEGFIAGDLGIEVEIRFFFDHMRDTIIPWEHVVPWFEQLHKMGLKVYYLSNYPEYLFEQTNCHMPFLPYADGGVFSFREKVMKPDPEIYRRLTDRYGLKPEECLFFDDRPVNVEAARKFGMQAAVYTDLGSARREIALRLQRV